MGLKIYSDVTSGNAYSINGLYTDPLIESFDGRVGGTVEKKLYIRNDDATKQYSSIVVSLVQAGGSINYRNGAYGFAMKMKSGNGRPTEAEWATISANNTISLSDISDTTTYLPFWLRIEVPSRIKSQHISNVSIKISATETV